MGVGGQKHDERTLVILLFLRTKVCKTTISRFLTPCLHDGGTDFLKGVGKELDFTRDLKKKKRRLVFYIANFDRKYIFIIPSPS